jgi:alkaline phosphatase
LLLIAHEEDMKSNNKWFITVSLAALVCLMTAGAAQAVPHAKYVFLFIGDGMGSVQINATEAYLANKVRRDEVGGVDKAELLRMSKLSVQGMCTTFPYNSYITDSAPAATALATGKKTADGVISMDPTKTIPYATIAEQAKAAGMKVGIISSVSIDHATPACFYAHEPLRGSYHNIGHQAYASGFDFFGGGGFKAVDGPLGNVLTAAQAAGYVVADTKAEIDALKPGQKAIAINPVLDDLKNDKALFYDIDRTYAVANDSAQADNHLTLAQFTSRAVSLLEKGKGFFLMVEGGKVDWACHANDARTVFDDMAAFDDAIGVALKFMHKHPRETLIVVTGDHETGGMTIGWAGTAYASYFEKLENQKISYVEFDKIWNAYKTACGAGCPADLEDALKTQINTLFGLDYTTLNNFEKLRLEDAYDKSLGRTSPNLPEEDALLYGTNTPLTVTITHILNKKAGIAWTSYAHTGVPVPVLAHGYGAGTFNGFYDNTDVAKKIAKAMRLTLPN